MKRGRAPREFVKGSLHHKSRTPLETQVECTTSTSAAHTEPAITKTKTFSGCLTKVCVLDGDLPHEREPPQTQTRE